MCSKFKTLPKADSGAGGFRGSSLSDKLTVQGLERFQPSHRAAYVFYATDDRYALAVLVVRRFLERLETREDADYVVIHLGVSSRLVAAMRASGMITVRSTPLRFVYEDWYRDCLTKLRVFQLTEYDRIIYLDADTIPLKPLDELFDLPDDVTIAAPRAYWLEQPWVTTFLMVVKPREDHWSRVEAHFASARANRHYDMDIVNIEFNEALYFLDDKYGCISKEWESSQTPFHFGDPHISISQIPIVHWSTFGKPWYHTTAELRAAFPQAHEILYELWSRWRAELKSVTTGIGRPAQTPRR